MVFNQTKLATEPEILKRKCGGEYFKNVTLASGAFTNGVCKAGNPIAADGTKANTADAIGILLSDAYAENPNATVVAAFAVINEANANANAGITISTAAKGALKNLIFE